MSQREAASLRIIDDPLAWVRKDPWRFFESGAFQPVEVVEMLLGTALHAGAEDVDVKRLGRWWLVAADRDWLVGVDDQAFDHITPIGPERPNEFRPEILLVAFARTVVTGTYESKLRSVRGRSDERLRRWWNGTGTGEVARLVAFKE